MANSATTTMSEGVKRREAPEGKASNGVVKDNGATTETEKKEHDFFWTYTEEPHRTRRLAIIKAHPEVCHLFLRINGTKY